MTRTSAKITFSFILFPNKKSGPFPVVLKACSGGSNPKKYSTGITAHPHEWDKATRRIYNKVSGAKKKNDQLDELEEYANHIIKTARFSGDSLSLDDFMSKIKGEKSGGEAMLIEFYDKVIKEYKSIDNAGQVFAYTCSRNAVKRFIKNDMPLEKVTTKLLHEMELFWRQGGATNGGISYYMRELKALLNKASSRKIYKKDNFPFSAPGNSDGYKIPVSKSTHSKSALSKEDLEKIKNFDYSLYPELAKVNDAEIYYRWFMSSYYAYGLRFTDLARFEEAFIFDGFLEFKSKKTSTINKVPLHPKFIEQVEWFMNMFSNSKYIFGILNEKIHKTEQQKFDRIAKKRKHYNKFLDLVKQCLSIKADLTSKSARHSMASHLKREGTEITTISKFMHGGKLDVTQRYFADEEEEKLLETLNVL